MLFSYQYYSKDCTTRELMMPNELEKKLRDIFKNYLDIQVENKQTPTELAKNILRQSGEKESFLLDLLINEKISSLDTFYVYLQKRHLERFRQQYQSLFKGQHDLAYRVSRFDRTKENYYDPYSELGQRIRETLSYAKSAGFSNNEVKCLEIDRKGLQLSEPILEYEVNHDFEEWQRLFPQLSENKPLNKNNLLRHILDECIRPIAQCNEETVCYPFLMKMLKEPSELELTEFEEIVESTLIDSPIKALTSIALENFYVGVDESPGKARHFFQHITPLLVYYGMQFRELNSNEIDLLHQKYFNDLNNHYIEFNDFSTQWASYKKRKASIHHDTLHDFISVYYPSLKSFFDPSNIRNKGPSTRNLFFAPGLETDDVENVIHPGITNQDEITPETLRIILLGCCLAFSSLIFLTSLEPIWLIALLAVISTIFLILNENDIHHERVNTAQFLSLPFKSH